MHVWGRRDVQITGELGEATVDVPLVDRADALGCHGDLAQVVEGRHEHLLRRGEVAGIGQFTGVEAALQHVDQALALLEQRVELFDRLEVRSERRVDLRQRSRLPLAAGIGAAFILATLLLVETRSGRAVSSSWRGQRIA